MRSIRSLIYAFLFTVAVQVATAQIKILYGPYLQNVKENEATIAWEADKPSIGWVELAPDDGTHYYGEERTKYFDTTNRLLLSPNDAFHSYLFQSAYIRCLDYFKKSLSIEKCHSQA